MSRHNVNDSFQILPLILKLMLVFLVHYFITYVLKIVTNQNELVFPYSTIPFACVIVTVYILIPKRK